MRNIEVDAVKAAFFHLEINGAGHHIAGGELQARIVRGHEARAIRQQQAPTLAPHGLADQERLGMRVVEASGVELYEFHVLHAATRAPGGGNAVAGGGVGVGGVEVYLASATGGQNGVGGAVGLHLARGLIQRVQAQTLSVWQAEFAAGDQVHQHVVV